MARDGLKYQTVRTDAASPTTSIPTVSAPGAGPKLCIVCNKANARLPGDQPLECKRCKRICHRGCLTSIPSADEIWWCPRCKKRRKEGRKSTPLPKTPRISTSAAPVQADGSARAKKRKSEPVGSAISLDSPATRTPVDKGHATKKDAYVGYLSESKGHDKMAMMLKYQESLNEAYNSSEPMVEDTEPVHPLLRYKQKKHSTQKDDQELLGKSHQLPKLELRDSFAPVGRTSKRGLGPSVTPEPKRQRRISPEIVSELTPAVAFQPAESPQLEYEPLVGSPNEIEEDSIKIKREDGEDGGNEYEQVVMEEDPAIIRGGISLDLSAEASEASRLATEESEPGETPLPPEECISWVIELLLADDGRLPLPEQSS
ncbi:hypothetical protein Dda_4589 [Drechslerella dactyloides]|uniref:PHD-type domain-containing protein n=1 Tax=Drechslerella dactyloides TaxID=74499 RepID=A0AAD6NKR1_DREDA|nr:hypothetical protein Dda_4589 [Drechslerella dactyloides]